MHTETSIALPILNRGAGWWVVGRRHASAVLISSMSMKDHTKYINTMCEKNVVFYGVKHGGMVATLLKKIYLYRRNTILLTASKNEGEREDFVLHFSAFQIPVIPNVTFSQTRLQNVLFKTWSGCTLVFFRMRLLATISLPKWFFIFDLYDKGNGRLRNAS